METYMPKIVLGKRFSILLLQCNNFVKVLGVLHKCTLINESVQSEQYSTLPVRVSCVKSNEINIKFESTLRRLYKTLYRYTVPVPVHRIQVLLHEDQDQNKINLNLFDREKAHSVHRIRCISWNQGIPFFE